MTDGIQLCVSMNHRKQSGAIAMPLIARHVPGDSLDNVFRRTWSEFEITPYSQVPSVGSRTGAPRPRCAGPRASHICSLMRALPRPWESALKVAVRVLRSWRRGGASQASLGCR